VLYDASAIRRSTLTAGSEAGQPPRDVLLKLNLCTAIATAARCHKIAKMHPCGRMHAVGHALKKRSVLTLSGADVVSRCSCTERFTLHTVRGCMQCTAPLTCRVVTMLYTIQVWDVKGCLQVLGSQLAHGWPYHQIARLVTKLSLQPQTAVQRPHVSDKGSSTFPRIWLLPAAGCALYLLLHHAPLSAVTLLRCCAAFEDRSDRGVDQPTARNRSWPDLCFSVTSSNHFKDLS
jgi:hypothetical protein